MKLKRFNEYVNEDYSSEYNIETPPTGDGDDLTTQDDESAEMGEHGVVGHEEDAHDGAEVIGMDVKGELSKLGMEILQKIALGEIDAATLAQEILDGGEFEDSDDMEDGDGDYEEDGEDEYGEDEYGDEESEMSHEEGDKFFPSMSLEESLKFKNFKKRK